MCKTNEDKPVMERIADSLRCANQLKMIEIGVLTATSGLSKNDELEVIKQLKSITEDK